MSNRLGLLFATQKAGCPTQNDIRSIKHLFGVMALQAVLEVKPWLTQAPSDDEEKSRAHNTKLFSQALGKRHKLIVDRLEHLLDVETLVPESLSGDTVDTWGSVSRLVNSVIQCSDCPLCEGSIAFAPSAESIPRR